MGSIMEYIGNNIQRFTFTYPQYPQSYPQHTTANNTIVTLSL